MYIIAELLLTVLECIGILIVFDCECLDTLMLREFLQGRRESCSMSLNISKSVKQLDPPR